MATQTSSPTHPRQRIPSAERRDLIVRAAVGAFAATGYEGTSTDDIARRAGVSQPYVVRLFGTKRELFIEVMRHGFGRIQEAFRAAAAETTDVPLLSVLGTAYMELIADRELLGIQLQGYAASSDAVIREEAKRQYGSLVEFVRELTGAPDEELQHFFALGMLFNTAVALDLPATPDVPWIATLLGEKCRLLLPSLPSRATPPN